MVNLENRLYGYGPISRGNSGGFPFYGVSHYSPLKQFYQVISDTDVAHWIKGKYESFKDYFLKNKDGGADEDDISPNVTYKIIISNGGGMPFGGPTSTTGASRFWSILKRKLS